MDAIARAWLEFAKDKTRVAEDSEVFSAFYASEDVEVDMLARTDQDSGLVIPVQEGTFDKPVLGHVVFVHEGVAIVMTQGKSINEVKFS